MYVYILLPKNTTAYGDNTICMSLLLLKKHDIQWRQYNMYVYITAKETRQPTRTKYAHIFFLNNYETVVV